MEDLQSLVAATAMAMMISKHSLAMVIGDSDGNGDDHPTHS